MKPINELGLELVEVGDNTYLIKGSIKGFEVFDLKHLIKEVQWEVIASVKPVEGLPLLVIEDEALIESEKWHETEKFMSNHIADPLSFQQGYNKAKETYKFTEEHLTAIRNKIIDLLPVGDVKTWDLIKAIQEYTKWFDEYVESLSQKELHIETEDKKQLLTNPPIDVHEPKIETSERFDGIIKAVWK